MQQGEVVEIIKHKEEKLGGGVAELASEAMRELLQDKEAGHGREAVHKNRLLIV